jgi:hypothetical protein
MSFGHFALLKARLEVREGLLRSGLVVKPCDDFLSETDLDVARIAPPATSAFHLSTHRHRLERQQLDVAPHQLVEIDISLPKI